MSGGTIQILHIEDNPGDVDLVGSLLEEQDVEDYAVEAAESLEDAIASLETREFDLVLLDLFLPDCTGLETFLRLRSHQNNVPVVVLSGLADVDSAMAAVREGAQDYLSKNELSAGLLTHTIRYALLRSQQIQSLRSQAMNDELTGLYNRRGFLASVKHHMAIANRSGNRGFLVFADVDRLKHINDTYGHQAGDEALVEAASALREVFRAADVIARIGGDEFAIFALENPEGIIGGPIPRLVQNLAERNGREGRPYELSMSVGVAHYDPSNPRTIEELIQDSDASMYRHKMNSRQAAAN